MIKEKFPAGSRVIPNGRSYTGTSKGYRRQWTGEEAVIVELDNGQTIATREMYLRPASEEDEAKSADLIARNKDIEARMKEKKEAGQKRREDLAELRRKLKQEETEAEEEAKRQAQIDHTAEMRRENAREYGLKSLRRG